MISNPSQYQKQIDSVKGSSKSSLHLKHFEKSYNTEYKNQSTKNELARQHSKDVIHINKTNIPKSSTPQQIRNPLDTKFGKDSISNLQIASTVHTKYFIMRKGQREKLSIPLNKIKKIIYIQGIVRGMIFRNKLKQYCSAIRIQSFWRGFRIRRNMYVFVILISFFFLRNFVPNEFFLMFFLTKHG